MCSFVCLDQVIDLIRLEIRPFFGLLSSPTGGAPTPKSRDLAEDERLQQANRLIQVSRVEICRCADDPGLTED